MNARVLFLILSAVAPTSVAWAHHSMSEYDFEKSVEIEGTLVDVRWQNPHIRLSVRSGTDTQGKPVVWEIEGSSLSVLRRMNVTPEKLKAGDTVRVFGYRSRRAPNRMVADNLLQADGSELVFLPGVNSRWASTAIGSKGTWLDAGTPEKASASPSHYWVRSRPLPRAQTSRWATLPQMSSAKTSMVRKSVSRVIPARSSLSASLQAGAANG